MRASVLLLLLPLVAVVRGKGVPFILDTDMGGGGCTDVDDVGAVCITNALADNGDLDLLAVVISTSPDKCPGAASVLNTYYGRPDVPIGAYKGSDLQPSNPHSYVDDIVDNWPSPIKHRSEVPSSVEVYRKVLAAQADHSVVVVTVGLLTCLAALFRSGGDKYSPLSGYDLFGQKVKVLGVMGGTYPNSGGGAECNFCGGGGQDHATGSAASAYVVSHLPPGVRVMFSGFNVGVNVYSGAALTSCAPAGNPCRQAYIDFNGPNGNRNSWDPLTVVAAVRGAQSMSCHEAGQGGKCEVDSGSGGNWWVDGSASNQTYLKLDDAGAAGSALDQLLCQPPAHPPAPTPPPTPVPVPGMCALATGAPMDGAGPAMTGYGGGDYTMAWDGEVRTFYDYSGCCGGWTQASLPGASTVARIEYYPRSGYLERYHGGRFVGISTTGGEVELATIGNNPTEIGWSALSVSASQAVTAVKYYAPDNAYGNIAEIRVYTAC